MYVLALLCALALTGISVRLGRPLNFVIGVVHVVLYGWLLLGSSKKRSA